MQAVQLRELGELVLDEIDEPVAGEGELLVKVEVCGLCGSDRHIIEGEYPSSPPVTLGHEFGGTVVDAGPSTSLPVGARVTVDPNISCGACVECRLGRVSYCSAQLALGVQLNGGLAEYVVVPEKQAYELPSDLPITHAAFCEPIACCLRGLDLAAIRPGDSVAVFGGGVIGQLMVQLARLAGASTVVLSTRQASRRELAEQLGATATVDPTATDPVAAITGASGIAPGGVDVVLECAGVVDTFEQSLAVARRGGSIVVFGVAPQGVMAQVSPFDILVRELRIQGSFINPLTHGRAADMVASGVLELDALVSREMALSDVPAAMAVPPGQGDVKYLVRPGS